ncbi:MAG: TonB family protein [Thermoanaerobaculia bacterium]
MKSDNTGLLGLDPSRPEDATPIPWPPPGGLDSSQDPFARLAPGDPSSPSSASPADGEAPDPVAAPSLLGLPATWSTSRAPRKTPTPKTSKTPKTRAIPKAETAPLTLPVLQPLAARPVESDPRLEDLPVPLFALDLEEKAAEAEVPPSRWGFTKDRAVALSVVLHFLFAISIIVAPPPQKTPENPDELPPDLLGLNKLWAVPPREPPIPIQFFPAPGPKASQPGPNPRLSDIDRKAGGGDPKLPRAETPKSVAGPGVRDLAPGKSGKGEGPDQAARAAVEAARQAQGDASKGNGGTPDDVSDSGKGTPSRKGLAGLTASPLKQISAADAARVAAQEGRVGGGGDEGGGWESEGGFVDSGPLSFDTKGYDWGPYAAEMIRKIKRNWEIPKLAHYGLKGRLVIRFYLMKDGRVEGLRILVSSGIPPYDNASLQAVRNSSPFRAIPPDFPNPREGVTITFLYNIRPEDLDSFDQQAAPPRPLLPR